MIDKHLIIEEIAKKHKVLLSEDDPIFTVIYLHDAIFDQYTAKVDKSIQSLAIDIEAITARYRENSRELAEEIVGQTVDAAKAEIQTAGSDTAADWRAQMEKILRVQSEHLASARLASRFALVGAGLSIIALAGVVASLIAWGG